jgi:hypothetical protein
MIVIVINGPTCSGKDTLVDALAERITNRDVLYFTPKHLLCKWVGSKYGLNPKSVWQINADKMAKVTGYKTRTPHRQPSGKEFFTIISVLSVTRNGNTSQPVSASLPDYPALRYAKSYPHKHATY